VVYKLTKSLMTDQLPCREFLISFLLIWKSVISIFERWPLNKPCCQKTDSCSSSVCTVQLTTFHFSCTFSICLSDVFTDRYAPRLFFMWQNIGISNRNMRLSWFTLSQFYSALPGEQDVTVTFKSIPTHHSWSSCHAIRNYVKLAK